MSALSSIFTLFINAVGPASPQWRRWWRPEKQMLPTVRCGSTSLHPSINISRTISSIYFIIYFFLPPPSLPLPHPPFFFPQFRRWVFIGGNWCSSVNHWHYHHLICCCCFSPVLRFDWGQLDDPKSSPLTISTRTVVNSSSIGTHHLEWNNRKIDHRGD